MTETWTREALAQRVYEILKNDLLSVGEGFTVQSGLIEAGLDSLAITQLLLAIEESTGIWVDESLLTPEILATSETLAECIHGLLRAA